MDLVSITISGAPAREVPELPEAAREALAGTAMLYREEGFEPPWIGYLVIVTVNASAPAHSNARRGTDASSSPTSRSPDTRDAVLRHACAASSSTLARRADPAIVITAQTLPERNASTRVLEKTGFRWDTELDHPEDGRIWEWRLDPVGGSEPDR